MAFQTGKDTVSFFEQLRAEASAEWRAYTEHPFTNGMADGSLPEAAFRHYLVQDYLFLIEFARAYALSVYKSPSLADMREGAGGLSAILDVEMHLHVKLCAGWGLSPADLERAPPAAEMLAYTRYVLDAGMRGDLLALKVALAPCVIGYAEIATRLTSQPNANAPSNPYSAWIAEYAGAPYQEVATKAWAHLDRLAELYATPARKTGWAGSVAGAPPACPAAPCPAPAGWPACSAGGAWAASPTRPEVRTTTMAPLASQRRERTMAHVNIPLQWRRNRSRPPFGRSPTSRKTSACSATPYTNLPIARSGPTSARWTTRPKFRLSSSPVCSTSG